MANPSERGPRSRRDAELDFEDFLDLRRTSQKNESKRKTRADQKRELRDAVKNPDALDDYHDRLR